MRRRLGLLWCACVLVVCGLSAQQGAEPAVSQALLAKYKPARSAFQFGLIGDQQYTPEQEAQFPAVLRAMDREPLAFVVHDGDLKGRQRCTDELLLNRLQLFQSSTHPFVYTPGDNDWTDCHQADMGGYDPLERLAKVREVFFADAAHSLGKRKLSVTSQSEQPRFKLFKENVLWTTGEVVFATVHTVGSNNGRGRNAQGDAEFQARTEANLTWLRTVFSLGDTHYFRIDKPLLQGQGPRSNTAPSLRNFTRVETFGPPDLYWLRARVVPSNPNIFLFEPEVMR